MPIDLTRSVLAVFIPGAVAVSPWLLALVLYTAATLGYLEKYNTLAHAFLLAVIAVAGLSCQMIASWIEVRWDKEREATFEVTENWYVYLAKKVDPEPVGYRYMSRLATMFYFELTMLVAIVPFSSGAAVLIWFRFPDERGALLFALAVAALLVFWFFRKNARATHEVLCKTRRELNAR
jgi:hypothetical protein